MKTSTAIGVIAGAIVIVTASILVESWLLGLILSWFNVSLTFGQNLAIVVLGISLIIPNYLKSLQFLKENSQNDLGS